MNRVTISDILRLFCCPPRPSRIIAKLAFLPPEATYEILSESENLEDGNLVLKEEAGWQFGDILKDKIEVFYTQTRENSRIACMYIRTDQTDPPPYTILFSHGNAVDLGQMSSFLQSLSMRFGVNILCYDYSGYGVSTGQALEVNLYADADAALQTLRKRYNCSLDKIVLYGQSIGTAPTVHLATHYVVAGVVLHSPLMSGLSVVCPGTTRRYCFDPFDNINKVARIKSPSLIIHGTDDDIIDVNHGKQIFNQLEHPLEPAWIEGAGHNDVEAFPEYAERLTRFFTADLPAEAEALRNLRVSSASLNAGSSNPGGDTKPDGVSPKQS